MRLLVLVLLLLAASAVSAQAWKRVQDWVGGCDNTRRCTAVGFAPAGQAPATLHFERGGGGGGGDSVQRITLRIQRERHWILQADGAELIRFTDHHLENAQGDQDPSWSITDEDEIAALLATMRDAQLLTLVGGGEPTASISLDGASAILLWIDEQQLRPGTRTALVRMGDRPSSSVPDPPQASAVFEAAGGQALDDAEASRLGAGVRGTLAAGTCDDLGSHTRLRDRAWLLAEGLILVQLRCWAAAYNFGSRWFLLGQSARPTSIAFPVPTTAEGDTLTDLVNADFDPATGRLRMFNKGRGPGDCGSSGEWAWNGQRFELVDFRVMSLCRGASRDLWPRLWRSRSQVPAP